MTAKRSIMSISGLPVDILRLIFLQLPLTSQRRIVNIDKYHNSNLLAHLQKQIADFKILIEKKGISVKTPREICTIELLYEGYSKLLPKHYYTENEIIYSRNFNRDSFLVSGGHLSTLSFLSHLCTDKRSLEIGVIEGGHLDLLIELIKEHPSSYIDCNDITVAFRYKHLHIIKFL